MSRRHGACELLWVMSELGGERLGQAAGGNLEPTPGESADHGSNADIFAIDRA
jgi:hypothetical protein